LVTSRKSQPNARERAGARKLTPPPRQGTKDRRLGTDQPCGESTIWM